MNYSGYLKMNASQLDAEITKQKQKIKNINETIVLLRKLKIAAEISEKDQTNKTEKLKTEQVKNQEVQQSEKPKIETEQQVKPKTQDQSQSQQHQHKVGGFFNGSHH